MGRFYRETRNILIPIIDSRRQIVGWTSTVPEYIGASLRNPAAERLVGPIMCLYVEIQDKDDSRKAGAPPDWSGPWRCLAICSAALPPEATGQPIRTVDHGHDRTGSAARVH